jgi:hypothetical protein
MAKMICGNIFLITLAVKAVALPAASVNEPTLVPRQAPGASGASAWSGLTGMLGSFAKSYAKAPTSVQKVEPLLEKTATRQIVRWGPYELKPAGVSFQIVQLRSPYKRLTDPDRVV